MWKEWKNNQANWKKTAGWLKINVHWPYREASRSDVDQNLESENPREQAPSKIIGNDLLIWICKATNLCYKIAYWWQ